MRFASLISCFVQPDIGQPSAEITMRLFHALRLRVARPLCCFELLLRTGKRFAGRSVLLRRQFQRLGELSLLALQSLPSCDNRLGHAQTFWQGLNHCIALGARPNKSGLSLS